MLGSEPEDAVDQAVVVAAAGVRLDRDARDLPLAAGGRGGSIYLRAEKGASTLLPFAGRRQVGQQSLRARLVGVGAQDAEASLERGRGAGEAAARQAGRD